MLYVFSSDLLFLVNSEDMRSSMATREQALQDAADVFAYWLGSDEQEAA